MLIIRARSDYNCTPVQYSPWSISSTRLPIWEHSSNTFLHQWHVLSLYCKHERNSSACHDASWLMNQDGWSCSWSWTMSTVHTLCDDREFKGNWTRRHHHVVVTFHVGVSIFHFGPCPNIHQDAFMLHINTGFIIPGHIWYFSLQIKNREWIKKAVFSQTKQKVFFGVGRSRVG